MSEPPRPDYPEMVRTSFVLPKELRRALKIAAAREERDMSELVAEALEAYLAKSRTSND